MEHEQYLRRAILEHPAADAPRLVYADWLEEHGDTQHAELIRVQIELANLPAKPPQFKIDWHNDMCAFQHGVLDFRVRTADRRFIFRLKPGDRVDIRVTGARTGYRRQWPGMKLIGIIDAGVPIAQFEMDAESREWPHAGIEKHAMRLVQKSILSKSNMCCRHSPVLFPSSAPIRRGFQYMHGIIDESTILECISKYPITEISDVEWRPMPDGWERILAYRDALGLSTDPLKIWGSTVLA